VFDVHDGYDIGGPAIRPMDKEHHDQVHEQGKRKRDDE
jgi:hypothetical protein